MTHKTILVHPEAEAGQVRCLGWCGEFFLSPDKKRIRFCRNCSPKKEQAERGLGKIRALGDDVRVAE